MMRRGPKPKSTVQRRLEGNPGRRPYNDDEPQLPTAGDDFDDVPDALAGDAVAIAEWQRLAPLLRQARVVTDADRNALIAACQQWSIYRDALVQAPPARRVLRSPNDYPLPNPFLAIANKALLHCERLWDSLGLTPSARTRVTVAPEQRARDPFAEFDEPRARRVPRLKEGPTFAGRRYAEPPKPN